MGGKRFMILAVCGILSIPCSIHAVTHNVTIGDNFFSPSNLTINPGDSVRWTYSGSRTHDATADDFGWASPTSSSIDFTHTFSSVDEVPYHCTIHSSPGGSSMNGNISVVAVDENQPPTANFSFNCTALDCDFTDTSSDSDGTIASWSWDFDDGASSSARNPGHSYAAAGTYTVILTATDNDGAQDSTNRMVIVSVSLPDPIAINIGMTDAWFDPNTDGQGQLIVVWEGIKFIFMAWFTFDTERPPDDVLAILGAAGQRWITAQGPYDGDTATLEAFLTSGGVFDSEEPPAVIDPEPIGTITIKWTSCNAGTLTYDFPSLGLMGEIAIERVVVADHHEICEAGQDAG